LQLDINHAFGKLLPLGSCRLILTSFSSRKKRSCGDLPACMTAGKVF